jgi:hypothetical protein
LIPNSTAPKSNTSIAAPSAIIATQAGPEIRPNACHPSAVSARPWTMTGPTPTRADSRSAKADASTQPRPPNT